MNTLLFNKALRPIPAVLAAFAALIALWLTTLPGALCQAGAAARSGW